MLIKQLTDLNGLPGCEKEVREFIKSEIKDYVDEVKVDRLGSLIAVKNRESAGPHLALSAHMDEVGLMINWIDDEGYLKFDSWGVDARVLPAKIVTVGRKQVKGVIGAKPIHLQEPDERTKAIPVDKLYIDIGAKDKKEAESLVSIGDFAAFENNFTEFGDYKIKAKALDDRIGCAAIIEVLKSDIPYKITACFNVQEETGLRGSMTTAFAIDADLVLNIEGTISADTPGVDPHMTVNVQGMGPSLSLIDRTSVYLKKYIDAIVEVAKKNNIPYQFRRAQSGGTDAGNYHTAKEGTPAIGIAVPCRYIHSPVSVMDRRDFENMLKLVHAFVKEFGEGTIL